MTRATTEPSTDVADRFGAWARVAVPMGLALVLVPLLVSAIVTLTGTAPTPIRDQALMEMRVRDIGIHAVDLGLYSRDGWSHLGPLVFYTLALPYRIIGSSTSGMVVGALIVNALSIVGIVAVARRIAGRRIALVMLLLVSVLVRALGALLVANPWVLFITVLPFALFCLVVWALLLGRAWALPAGAALATWLVQTHVGYAPITLPLLGVGGIGLVVVSWRCGGERRATMLRAGAWTAGILVVVWALPAWDQVSGTGNFVRAARWFNDAKEGVHSLGEGIRVVVGQFAIVPDWVTGTRRVSPFNGETTLRTHLLWPVLLLPFAAALFVAVRRRSHRVVALGVVVGATVVLGVIAVARTIGTMYEYRMLFIWVVGGLAGAVIVWVLWDLVADRFPRTDLIVVPVILLGLAMLAGVEIDQATTAPLADWNSRSTAAVLDRLTTKLDRHGGEIILRSETASSEWYLQGVLLGLDKRGFPARVRGTGGGLYPPDLSAGPGRDQAHLRVVAGPELARLDRSQVAKIVAYGGPLPLHQELRALRAFEAKGTQLFAALKAHTISTEEFLARNQRRNQALLTAVALVPDDDPGSR
ncbi:MAG: hypothetical protein ABJC79_01990 [Acidimicrobiia bacterium]